ncbi:MAG: DUF1549 domain-containing protein, partial [Limisphaerales bacterium]
MIPRGAQANKRTRRLATHILLLSYQAVWVWWLLSGVQAEIAQEGSPPESLWSLSPLLAPTIPPRHELSDHPIDRFLAKQRHSLGLKTVGRADPLTLLRRVHLDLTGLPPSLAEQDAFMRDPSAESFKKVVNSLLESEQHAVRYARHWLDVLRYADADAGMMAAPGIHLWRDWVIGALHEDLPFDDFVQIQLTGRRAAERTRMSAT